MSFDRDYPNRKDRRKFVGKRNRPKIIDATCRNHGSCEWCRGNRTHKNKKRELAAKEKEC